MIMKKIIALVLVLVTSAFVMIGCSKSGSGDDPYSIAKALENSYYQSAVLGKQYDVKFTSLKLASDGVGVENGLIQAVQCNHVSFPPFNQASEMQARTST